MAAAEGPQGVAPQQLLVGAEPQAAPLHQRAAGELQHLVPLLLLLQVWVRH